MFNKKGFTLIEIIVSITILILISTITILLLNKNNDINNFKEINNKIIEAANVYISNEKDDNGDTFEKGINNGGVGVIIPLTRLEDTGYIAKDQIETLENKGIDVKKAYLTASYYAANSSECSSNNMIEFKTSWDVNNQTMYLCPATKTVTKIDSNIMNHKKTVLELGKWAVSQEYYDNSTSKDNLTASENGIFDYFNATNNNEYFFYRGAVDYNYLKFGKDSSGNDLIFRIIWYRTNDKKMKIILNTPIEIFLENHENQMVSLKNIRKLTQIYAKNKSISPDVPFIDNSETHSTEIEHTNYSNPKYKDTDYYENYYSVKKYMFKDIDLNYSYWSSTYAQNNIYYKKMVQWYESTNLNTFNIITNNSFCENDKFSSTWNKSGSTNKIEYELSDNFDCPSGNSVSSNNFKVGYLTYGDAYYAGVGTNNYSNIIDTGNYLFSTNDDILLGNICYFQKNEADTYFRKYHYKLTNGFVSYKVFDWSFDDEKNVYGDKSYYYHYQFDDNGSFYHNNVETLLLDLSVNTIKPALVLNMDSCELKNDGTINNPFEIVCS